MASDEQEKATVLIVHGTFSGRPEDDPAQNETADAGPKWYEPGEKFCAELDAALAKRGSNASCWQHLNGAKHFYWDGANNWLSRSRAALRLRREIRQLNAAGWVVHLVGHSHGGNVIIDAVTQKGRRSFPWFKGRAVLLGTPIYLTSWDYEKRETRLLLTWLLLAAMVWGVALFFGARGVSPFAALADGTWTQNYAIVALALGFLAATTFLIPAWRFLTSNSISLESWSAKLGITAAFTPPREMRNSPNFMLINSRYDEALKSLSALKEAPNPLVSEAGEGKASARDIVAPVSNSLRTIIFGALGIKKFWPYLIGGAVLVLAAAFWQRIAQASGVPSALGLSLTLVTILAAVLVLTATFRGFFSKALLAPGVALYGALRLAAGTLKGALLHLFDHALRGVVWGFVRTFGLGVGGGPRGSADITVRRTFTSSQLGDGISFELPDAIVEDIKTEQRKNLGKFHDVLYSPTIEWYPMELKERLEKIGFPLIHTAYYEQPACVELIADWICEPMEELRDYTLAFPTTTIQHTRDGVGYGRSGMTEGPNPYRQHVRRLKEKYYGRYPDWVIKPKPIVAPSLQGLSDAERARRMVPPHLRPRR